MLVQLGHRRASTLLVDALADCHEKIRLHVELAKRLAGASPAANEEIAQVATRIIRYFQKGLPQHVRDEEDSLAPRLTSLSAELDRALAEMKIVHARHEPWIAELCSVAEKLRVHPQERASQAKTLDEILSRLSPEMEAHLQLEEQAIFPSLRHLGTGQEAEIRAEIAARRGHLD